MKNHLLTFALLISFFAEAQTEQGRWFAEGGTAFSYSSTQFDGVEQVSSNLRLQSKVGTFVMDDLNLGLLIGVDNTREGGNRISTSSIGPFFRYYANGTFFFGASYLFTSAQLFGLNVNGQNFVAEVGLPIWLKDNIALEPALNYVSGMGELQGSTSFAISLGFGLYF